jgi:D-glycero-beta-D-manno-heptose 1-phosphate adenylyltransferase
MPPLSLADMLAQCEEWRAAGISCVLTNGVFDLLHAGHVGYLERARALGDRLVIALNSDTSVRAIKGPLRPIVAQAERATLLAALRCVDAVTIFDTPTAEPVVAALQPAIYVKGGDYARADGTIDEARLPEARSARAYGGQVVLLPYAEGSSTSALIERIVDRYKGIGSRE